MSKNPGRYSLFPIKYPNLYKFYEQQRDSFWVPAEIDLDTDIKDWKKLSKEDKHFISHVLAFFAQSDALVLDNLNINFSVDVDIPEAKIFFAIQGGSEAIHWEMYNLLIQVLITDPVEKHKAFNAIAEYPCIQKKADWIMNWMNTSKKDNLLERIIAFSCVEGIFFSASFACIFYYKSKALLPGLIKSNEFIARDEGIHRDFGCTLFKLLRKENSNQITDEVVYDIVKSAVDIECSFVSESLNVDLVGINKNLMCDYVRFVSDHLLVELGLQKYYNVKNPFNWMQTIGMKNKQNFFENRVSDYSKPSSSLSFEIGDDF